MDSESVRFFLGMVVYGSMTVAIGAFLKKWLAAKTQRERDEICIPPFVPGFAICFVLCLASACVFAASFFGLVK